MGKRKISAEKQGLLANIEHSSATAISKGRHGLDIQQDILSHCSGIPGDFLAHRRFPAQAPSESHGCHTASPHYQPPAQHFPTVAAVSTLQTARPREGLQCSESCQGTALPWPHWSRRSGWCHGCALVLSPLKVAANAVKGDEWNQPTRPTSCLSDASHVMKITSSSFLV